MVKKKLAKSGQKYYLLIGHSLKNCFAPVTFYSRPLADSFLCWNPKSYYGSLKKICGTGPRSVWLVEIFLLHLCRYLAFRRNSSRSISGSRDWMRRDLVQYFSNYPPELLCFVIPNILIPTIHCWVFYGIHSSYTQRISKKHSHGKILFSPPCVMSGADIWVLNVE